MSRYFISGIGTGVGKTLMSAVLAEALNADYWKPIQCGTKEGTDTKLVSSLISNTTSNIHNESYIFEEPASPHLAAALVNEKIRLEKMHLPETSNILLIEGAGGLMVPLNDTNFVVDLAKEFEAEIILVVRNYLGCINHSILSLNYLVHNGFDIKGLILNGNFDPAVKLAITNYAEVPVIAEIPEVAEFTKEAITNLAHRVNVALFENE